MPPIPPRVLRFQSSLTRRPAFGLVLTERGGVPEAVFNLTELFPQVGGTFAEFLAAGGFERAEEIWGTYDAAAGVFARDALEQHREVIEPAQLLPPVDVSDDDIRARRRFILSMGLNYDSHRRETGRGADLIMVNATGTTGPCNPLTLTPEALLVDYEAEVGCVLLDDLDLSAIPPMDALERRLAHFTANDLNDRAPMILDEVEGYTAGKSDPGFVAIGPWMVHGAALPIFSQRLGLEIRCTVTRPGQPPQLRQRDRTTGILRDPSQILHLLAAKLAEQPDLAHPDRRGERHPFALRVGDRHVLPAGSILLTGTPGGTCLRAPGLLGKMGLLVRGGFTMAGARRAYVRSLVRRRGRLGYLLPGDVVETSVEGLGTQRWEVRG